MADAFPFAFDAKVGEKLFIFSGFEFFFGAVDPDTPEPERMRRQHQVPQNETSVIDAERPVLIRQDDQDDRGAVKGVEPLFPSADFAVVVGKSGSELRVGYGDNDGRLPAFTARGVQPGFDDLIDVRFGRRIRFEFADAAAFLDCFENFVHDFCSFTDELCFLILFINPDASKAIVSVKGVPLGTQDNLLCVTGGEGTGKSNYISAILSGALGIERLNPEQTLGLEITANPKGLAVLHYDTEQSEAQLYKNLGKTLRRASLSTVPEFYHSLYLASFSRKDRLKLIRESMDLFHHKHGGIHLVVIDGIADLIRSANDESESIAIVDDLYRLAGVYNTCIICVLHFVPNGIKLRGHIGSELQRKAAGILSIEKDDNPEYSVVKALKVRDGSPLDVPMILFGWDKDLDMHVYRGEKSKEEKEKRKTDELIAVVREAFKHSHRLSYQELCEVLMREMEIKERTAKKYIAYMREQEILTQDTSGYYQRGELCRI